MNGHNLSFIKYSTGWKTTCTQIPQAAADKQHWRYGIIDWGYCDVIIRGGDYIYYWGCKCSLNFKKRSTPMRVQAQPGRGQFADLRWTAFSLERASFGLGGLSLDIKGPSARLRVSCFGLGEPLSTCEWPLLAREDPLSAWEDPLSAWEGPLSGWN